MVHHFLIRSFDVLLFVAEVPFAEVVQHALPLLFVLEAPLVPLQSLLPFFCSKLIGFSLFSGPFP